MTQRKALPAKVPPPAGNVFCSAELPAPLFPRLPPLLTLPLVDRFPQQYSPHVVVVNGDDMFVVFIVFR